MMNRTVYGTAGVIIRGLPYSALPGKKHCSKCVNVEAGFGKNINYMAKLIKWKKKEKFFSNLIIGLIIERIASSNF